MATEAQMVAAVKVVLPRFVAMVSATGTTRPYGTYQQVGGPSPNFLGGGVGGKRGARIQINVWATNTLQAKTLMRAVEEVLKASPFFADANGSVMDRYDPATKEMGAQQDFSFWFD